MEEISKMAAHNTVSWSFIALAATGAVCGTFLLRYMLDRLLFQHLAVYCLVEPDSQKKAVIPDKKLLDINRFCESCWKITIYCLMLATGMLALWDERWVWHTRQYWEGWPDQPITNGVKAYYAAELTFYLSSTFMLVLWEERRKDFHVMMLHHLMSVFLIAASYTTNFTRAGAVVMLLHDPSDIFLEAAKICDYAAWELPATGLFVLLLASWGSMRLVVLPLWIIRSAMWELPKVLGRHQQQSFVMTLLLCVLVVLHAYWFHLIVRIAVDFVRTGEKRDTRESKD